MEADRADRAIGDSTRSSTRRGVRELFRGVSSRIAVHLYCSAVMRLSEWATASGVHYQTAWRWVRGDRMPVPFVRTDSGTILVVMVPRIECGSWACMRGCPPTTSARIWIVWGYPSPKGDTPTGGVARLSQWAAGTGLAVARVGTEVGSGMRGRRPKLRRLLVGPGCHSCGCGAP